MDKISATDYSLFSRGVQTHQSIEICKSGLINAYQGAKERKVELGVDELGRFCVIRVDGEIEHFITAPFHIKFKEGNQIKQ